MNPQPSSTRTTRWVALALAVAAILTACGDDAEGGPGAGGRSTLDPGPAQTQGPSEPTSPGSERPILVTTQIRGFAGTVLPGSVIGDSPFCPGGTVRHERGSPDIGFPAINVIKCPDGRLEIGFGPGPDQMDNTVQFSTWRVLGGTGRFAELSGDGQMMVQWQRTGESSGREMFMGLVVVLAGAP